MCSRILIYIRVHRTPPQPLPSVVLLEKAALQVLNECWCVCKLNIDGLMFKFKGLGCKNKCKRCKTWWAELMHLWMHTWIWTVWATCSLPSGGWTACWCASCRYMQSSGCGTRTCPRQTGLEHYIYTLLLLSCRLFRTRSLPAMISQRLWCLYWIHPRARGVPKTWRCC